MRSLRGERCFVPFSVQRQVAFQHFGRIGKDRHQVRDEAEAFLDAFHGGLGGGWRIGDGQGFEEVCGGVHIIYWVGCFSFIFCLRLALGHGRRLPESFDVSNEAQPHGPTSGRLPQADES